MKNSAESRIPITVLVVVVGITLTGAFEISQSVDSQTVDRGENGTFYYRIVPWPPPCPSCQPSNTDLLKYEDVTILFFNGTLDDRVELCRIFYHDGEYVDNNAPCSASDPRLWDFSPTSTADGVTMRLSFVNMYDTGTYHLEILYDAPTETALTTMTVIAAPGSPTIDGPRDVTEGDKVSYNCTSTNAYPTADLQWTRQEASGGTVIISPVYYHKAEQWYEVCFSVIQFTVMYTDHGVSYVCSASNVLNQDDPATASIALNVKHVPNSKLKPCETRDIPYRVVEGRTAKFTCEISAYPPYTSVHWYQGTDPDTLMDPIPGTELNQTQYSVQDVQRYMDRWFGCNAVSSLDTGDQAYCRVDVQYPPEGDPFETQEMAEGASVTISCEADANPEVDSYVWSRDLNSSFRLEDMTLHIESMTLMHNDVYTCVATNTLTPTDQSSYPHSFIRKVEIFIPHAPVWEQYSLTKFTAEEGQSSSLVCSVVSYPQQNSFSWHHDGSSSSSRWEVVDEDRKSTLTIHDVEESDLGTYTCSVGNREGTAEFDLLLLEPGVPDAPQKCTETYAGVYNARLSCLPGYDGGGDLSAEAEVSGADGKRRAVPTTSEMGNGELIVYVEDLDPGLNQTLYVYGKNEYGTSSDSCVTYVKTQEGAERPPDEGAAEGVDTGLVIGLTIGMLLLVALIVAVVGVCYYKYEPNIKEDNGNDYVDLSKLTGSNDNSVTSSIGRRYAETGGYVNVPAPRRGYYDNKGFEGDNQHRNHPEYVNQPVGRTRIDLHPEPLAEEDLDGRRRKSTADNNLMTRGDVASVGSSSESSVGRQNTKNEAYELRDGQIDLAGAGALSQRSAMARGGKKPKGKRVTIVDPEEDGGGYGGDWEFPRDRIFMREKLGEGAFGEVWKAVATMIAGHSGMKPVAVKKLHENTESEQRLALMKELRVLQGLPPHLNIIGFLGCCTKQDPVLIIMEYASMGSLLEFIRISRNPPESARRLTTRDLVSFSLDVASGMEHVSAQGLLHRDLAARNILLDDRLVAKVADFGLARDIVHSRQYESKTQQKLPIRWMAPESLFDNVYSTKSDAWSFGILLWEIVTLGSSPYPGLTGPQVMQRIQRGYRMEKPRHCSDDLYGMMRDCWQEGPAQRLGFRRMRDALEKVLAGLDRRPEANKFVFHMHENMLSILENVPGEKC